MAPTEHLQQAIEDLQAAWEQLRKADTAISRYAANKIGIEIIRLQQLLDFMPDQ